MFAGVSMLGPGLHSRFVYVAMSAGGRSQEKNSQSTAGKPGSIGSGSITRCLTSAAPAGHGFFVPHGAVAAIALFDPDLLGWSTRSVRCECTGELTNGATVVDRRRTDATGSVSVAVGVDVPPVNTRILAALSSLE